MKPEEAIKVLKSKLHLDCSVPEAIGELEAREIAVEALEKQVPKGVTHEATRLQDCTCPNCGNVVSEFVKFGERKMRVTSPYCRICGQALDWEEGGEE